MAVSPKLGLTDKDNQCKKEKIFAKLYSLHDFFSQKENKIFRVLVSEVMFVGEAHVHLDMIYSLLEKRS